MSREDGKSKTANKTTPRRSDDIFKLLFSSIEDYAIITLDARGTIGSCNPGVKKLLGYSPKDLIGSDISTIYGQDPAGHSKTASGLKQISKKGRELRERLYVRKNGSQFFGSGLVIALKSSDDQLLGFSEIIIDITDQKAAQKDADTSRRQAEEELSTKSILLESMLEGVSLSNEEGIIVYTNPAEDKLFGYARGELVNQHVSVQNALL